MPHKIMKANGGDNVFIGFFLLSVCVFVCLSVNAQRKVNANSSKTVKSTELKFDLDVPEDSPNSIP